MKLIACVDQNWGIGFKGKLLLSIPEDMKYFKEMTMNKTIVMGRLTFESLSDGKPLTKREI
ncbi:MAG: dihydrofolate reductase, partial [Eubacteriales bacterium]